MVHVILKYAWFLVVIWRGGGSHVILQENFVNAFMVLEFKGGTCHVNKRLNHTAERFVFGCYNYCKC